MMKTAKQLELTLLCKEGTIQNLNRELRELESIIIEKREKIDKIKKYVKNNYQYVNDIMKQYFDMILYIINEGEQNED